MAEYTIPDSEKRQYLKNSKTYQQLELVQKVMDQYNLDGFIGLLPFGIGDAVSALSGIAYIWFSMTKIKSTSLTLAIIYNILSDILLGLIPFYVGDVIDFFFRSNRKNMYLIRGFVEGDKLIIKDINRKAVKFVFFIILLLVLIFVLAYFAVLATQWLYGLLFH